MIQRRLRRIIRPVSKECLQALHKSSLDDDEEKNDCSKNDEGELDGSTSPMDQEGVNEAGSDEKSVLTDDKAIFSIVQVNTYGADITEIKDKEQQFKFESHCHIATDWSSKAKELFYDAVAATDFDSDDSMSEKMLPKKQVVQLTDCLDLFTTMEKLGEHDLWYCPRCKDHKQATKKFDLWQLPDVLVIHLKRFSYTRWSRDKIDSLIEFPTKKLDMSRWVINKKHEPATYDLIAVTNHYGGLGGGHYTAFAKNQHDNQWYHFDDSCVSRTSEDQVVTKASYVLIYQRRGCHRSSQTAVLNNQNNHSANNNNIIEDMDSS